MKKLMVFLAAIFEFIYYTFFMVVIGNINITNKVIDLSMHFLSLIVIAVTFYYLLRFVFKKLGFIAKKYIYYVVICNLIMGLIVPVLLLIIIPNDTLFVFLFIVLISAVYYGIFINIVICFLNYFLTNRRKKLG